MAAVLTLQVLHDYSDRETAEAVRFDIAGTSVPDADAMIIIARRTRTEPCLPRRTICRRRLLIGQPPRSHRLSHRTLPALDLPLQDRVWEQPRVSAGPANVCGQPARRGSCEVTGSGQEGPRE
jgi:hypothetical protein